MDLLCESQKLLYVSIILKRKLSNMEEKCNLQWDLISTYYSPKMFGKKSFLRIPNILENLLLKRTFQEIDFFSQEKVKISGFQFLNNWHGSFTSYLQMLKWKYWILKFSAWWKEWDTSNFEMCYHRQRVTFWIYFEIL